jgi:hypothetical protein
MNAILSMIRSFASFVGYFVIAAVVVESIVPIVTFADFVSYFAVPALGVWVIARLLTDKDTPEIGKPAPTRRSLGGDGSDSSDLRRGAAARAADLAIEFRDAVEQLQRHAKERAEEVARAEAALEDVTQRRKELEAQTETAAEAGKRLEQYISRILAGQDRRKLRRDVLIAVGGALLGYILNEVALLSRLLS